MTGNLLIERSLRRNGGERIGAGQINQRYLVLKRGKLTFFAFYGDASPVSHALAGTRQLIKKRGFARVGVAD